MGERGDTGVGGERHTHRSGRERERNRQREERVCVRENTGVEEGERGYRCGRERQE